MLTHFSLFSGIGGADLAAEWAGFETVGQCEWADYQTKVLEKHWPSVPRWRDINDISGQEIFARGIRAIDVLSGGFPCQDVSSAAGADGAGFTKEDGTTTRSGLWFQMLRVIRETEPLWVVAENVAGLLSHGNGRTFETVISGLESADYTTLTILSPAGNQGASFEGRRVFIIAASNRLRHRGSATQKFGLFVRKLVESECEGCPVWGEDEGRIVHALRTQAPLPDNLRGDYGLPDWVDRVKCLGNVIVPQHIYPVFKSIAEVEAQMFGSTTAQ